MGRYYLLLVGFLCLTLNALRAQTDTARLPIRADTTIIPVIDTSKIPLDTSKISTADTTKVPAVKRKNVKPTDTTKKAVPDTTRWSNGKRAAIYSAVLPGAGQIYNKKYWKLPLVYGALAFPTYTFFYNLNWFQKTRLAYNTLFNIQKFKDSTNYGLIDPQLKPIVDRGDLSGLSNYRADFRRNVDYSVLGFILIWGLNVVDAAVDGHLKEFNITDDLSLHIKPGYLPISNTVGLGLVLDIGKNHFNRISSAR